KVMSGDGRRFRGSGAWFRCVVRVRGSEGGPNKEKSLTYWSSFMSELFLIVHSMLTNISLCFFFLHNRHRRILGNDSLAMNRNTSFRCKVLLGHDAQADIELVEFHRNVVLPPNFMAVHIEHRFILGAIVDDAIRIECSRLEVLSFFLEQTEVF